jgi:hypothetical protein
VAGIQCARIVDLWGDCLGISMDRDQSPRYLNRHLFLKQKEYNLGFETAIGGVYALLPYQLMIYHATI